MGRNGKWKGHKLPEIEPRTPGLCSQYTNFVQTNCRYIQFHWVLQLWCLCIRFAGEIAFDTGVCCDIFFAYCWVQVMVTAGLFHFLLFCLKASITTLFQREASRSYLPVHAVQPAECLHCCTPTASAHPVHIQRATSRQVSCPSTSNVTSHKC